MIYYFKVNTTTPKPIICPVDELGEIGDGFCDGFLNNEENCYDGGDCCGEDANMDFCHNGVCECVDPNYGRVLDFGLSIDSQFESHPWHLVVLSFYKFVLQKSKQPY